jgi:decaprenyl-phosphate phosphoribosyltransferase
MIKALRPKQWIKNLLVAAAPIAAGQFSSQLTNIVLGVIGFSAASSFGYLVNDWNDRQEDRVHDKKRLRPFASGALNFGHLIFLLAICAFVVIIVCLILPNYYSLAILVYLSVSIFYTFLIKKIPVLEMHWLTIGFLVRAVAGSTIIRETPTSWFIVTIGFGSLFIVATKRLAELQKNYTKETRRVANIYTQSFLATVINVSLAITLLTYSLWVFEVHPNLIFAQFSIFTFSLSFFLYALQSEKSDAETPENLFFSNKYIFISGLSTVMLLAIVIYK